MPKNVEIKARLRDRSAVEAVVRERADHGPELISQHDVFFNCSTGRLKLRRFADGGGELIFYRRDDAEAPAESEFCKAPVADPEALTGVLGRAFGVAGEVRKHRTLYLIGQTRVHLDAVEGLDDHLELEVVIEDGHSTEDGVAIAELLMEQLGIAEEDLVAEAYVDLLASSSDVQNS